MIANIDETTNVYTVGKIAKILHIGRNNAYRLVRTGKVRSIRIGRSIRISHSALMEFLNSAE